MLNAQPNQKRMVSPLYVGWPTNSSGNKCHSNLAEKNDRPGPEHANDHIHVAASLGTLTWGALLLALKTDAGWTLAV